MKKIRVSVELILLICIVSFGSFSGVQGFNVGLRGTSCSLSEDNFNDPCSSLYDAICDGAHCKCDSGTHLDTTLNRCVPGSAPKGAGAKGGGGKVDIFDDLPLDYTPGDKPKPKPMPKPDISEIETPDGSHQPSYPSQPVHPVQPNYPSHPQPAQPNNYPGQPQPASEDSNIGEKAGGGIGGGIGIAILLGLLYYCCKGDKGKEIMSKLPCFGGKADQGADYQMQQQQQDPQYPNAPPPAAV